MGGRGQTLVDAAYVAESFLRAYDQLWMPLDEKTKERYIACFTRLRAIDPPYTNWLLFSSTIEAFLAKAGAAYDTYRVNSAIRKVEEWYTGMAGMPTDRRLPSTITAATSSTPCTWRPCRR